MPLNVSISSALFSSVMSAGSAATGRPPLLPMMAWISGRMVMSMNSYASSLFSAFSGTTQRLPDEPSDRSAPGKAVMVQSKPVASATKRPYHQEPDTKMGEVPLMNDTPASSALTEETSFAM